MADDEPVFRVGCEAGSDEPYEYRGPLVSEAGTSTIKRSISETGSFWARFRQFREIVLIAPAPNVGRSISPETGRRWGDQPNPLLANLPRHTDDLRHLPIVNDRTEFCVPVNCTGSHVELFVIRNLLPGVETSAKMSGHLGTLLLAE